MSSVPEHPAASPAPPAQPEPEPGSELELESKAEAAPEEAPAKAPEEAPKEAPATAAAEEPQPPQQPEEEKKDTRPVKIIWIDVIDTPATRREKAKQKRLEREARKRAAAEAAAAPVAGPSRLAEIDVHMDVDSDLTDLDDDETEDDENVLAREHAAPPPPPRRMEPPRRVEPLEPGAIVLGEGEKLEGGTLGMHIVDRCVNDRSLTPSFSLGEDRFALLFPHGFRVSYVHSLADVNDSFVPLLASRRLRRGQLRGAQERPADRAPEQGQRLRPRAVLREENDPGQQPLV